MMRGGMCATAPRVGPWRVDETDAPANCGAWHLECAHHACELHDAQDVKIQYGTCSIIPRDVHVNVVVSHTCIASNVVAIVWPLREGDDGTGSDVVVGHGAKIFQHNACKHQALQMWGHQNLILDLGDGGVMRHKE